MKVGDTIWLVGEPPRKCVYEGIGFVNTGLDANKHKQVIQVSCNNETHNFSLEALNTILFEDFYETVMAYNNLECIIKEGGRL